MPLKRGDVPCHTATCDECGEGDNTEYGGSFHYDSREEMVKALEDAEWLVTEEKVLCEDCRGEEGQ